MATTELVLQTLVKGTETATKALNDVKGSLDGINKASESATQGTKKFTDKLRDNREGFVALGVGATAATAGIVMGISSAMDTFGDFEKTMSGVKAVLNPTGEEFDKMSAKARELGKSTTFSAKESASAMEMLAKNGLNATQILNGATDASLALAAATGADLSQAADIASSAMLVFGKNLKELDQVVNSITGTTNISKFGIEDYALALSQGGGVAKTVGVNFEDFNASIAAISPLFQSGSDAGTSFKTFLLRLSPTSDTAAEAMMALGLMTEKGVNKFYTASGQLKSMAEVSQILQDATKNLTDEQKNFYLNTIFGTDAMRAAAGMAGTGAVKFQELSKAIEGTDAAKNAAERLNNWKGAMEALNGTIDELKISLGETLAPVLKQLVTDLGPILNMIGTWVNEHPKLTAGIILTTLAITGITAALVALGFIIGPISAAFSAVGVVIGAISLPVIAITALIAALGYALYKVWEDWDTIKPKLMEYWIPIKEAFKKFFDWVDVYIKQILDGVKVFWKEWGDEITLYSKILWEGLKAGALIAFEFYKTYIASSWETIKLIFVTAFNIIQTIVEIAFAGIKMIFQNAFIVIKGSIEIFNQLMNGDFKGAFETLKGMFKEQWKIIQEFFETSLDSIITNFTDIGKQMYEAGKNIVKSLADGIAESFSYVTGAVKKISGALNFSSSVSAPNVSGKRALGGPVSGGKTYLVGEKGPELFTAGTSGQIIPNNRLSSSGGGIVINITGTFGQGVAEEIGNMIVSKLSRASYI